MSFEALLTRRFLFVAATPPPVQVVLDPPPNEQGNPGLVVCPGILIDYVINSLNFVPNPSGNVYAFDATIFFQNIGNVNLVNWRVSIGYQWNEQITRVVNLTLPTGAAPPALGRTAGLLQLPLSALLGEQAFAFYQMTLKRSGRHCLRLVRDCPARGSATTYSRVLSSSAHLCPALFPSGTQLCA